MALLTGAMLALTLPGVAAAAPIVPAAAPLSADFPAWPATCPQPEELDGTLATKQLGRFVRRTPLNRFSLLFGLESVPSPAVFLCDPPAASARRILGPLTGTTTVPVARDLSWFGTRGLVLATLGRQTPSLMPGDRVALPIVSPGAHLTVSVSTPGGARTLTVPAAAAAPSAVVIEGASTAPTLVVERAGAEPTRIAVEPRAVRPFRLRARVTASAVAVSGTAAPDTLILAATSRPKRTTSAALVVSERGQFQDLTLRGLTPKNREVDVVAVNLKARTTSTVRCKLHATKTDLTRATCSSNTSSLADPIGTVGSPAGVLSARSSAGNPAFAGLTGRRTRVEGTTPRARRGRAARGPKLATVEATVTEIARQPAMSQASLTPSDMNGDARPDLLVGSASDPTSGAALLASAGTGWTSVPIRAAPSTLIEALPDLDGDGLGEFQTETGVIVTDALAGPNPASINLRKTRKLSPRDLDLGASNAPAFQALQVFAAPFGALTDVTGDGRAELAFDFGGGIVYASEDIVHGRRARRADFAPVGFDQSGFGGLDFSVSDGAAPEATADAQQTGVTSLVRGRELVTVRPTDLNRRSTVARAVEIRTSSASGAVIARRTFQATGVALLVDHDPQTGESIVVLADVGPCRRTSDQYLPRPKKPGVKRKRCTDRLVRVLGDGTVASTVSFPRLEDELVDGTFIPDGRDADALPDIAVTAASSTSTAPLDPPARPTDGGTVALLASDRTGLIGIGDLPVFAEQGKILQSLVGYSSTVTADGVRWLAGGFQTKATASSFKELDALKQRVGLVSQTP